MKIHIKQPFWSAYQKYGWDDKIPGLGFKKKTVDLLAQFHEKITVAIGKDTIEYQIAAVTIQNLAKKYNSEFKARYDTIIYVIPQNKLRKIV